MKIYCADIRDQKYCLRLWLEMSIGNKLLLITCIFNALVKLITLFWQFVSVVDSPRYCIWFLLLIVVCPCTMFRTYLCIALIRCSSLRLFPVSDLAFCEWNGIIETNLPTSVLALLSCWSCLLTSGNRETTFVG